VTFKRQEVIPFVVLFQGRSGSTYLIEMLQTHPYVLARGEQLVELVQHGAERQLAWTAAYLTPPEEGVHAAIGFKTKLKDVLDPKGFGALLRRLNAKVVHLERKNVVKQAISWILADELYRTTGKWNLYRASDRIPVLRIDPALLAQRLEQIEAGCDGLRRYVNALRLPLYGLAYEQLMLDPAAAMRGVHGYLELPNVLGAVACRKHTPDDLRHIILNFDALRAQYAGTRHSWMFDEVLVPFAS
jgi:LPS sulfotransferase NodH